MKTDHRGGILATLAFVCLITCLWRPVWHGIDLWWHLADGRSIIQTHHIPSTDEFSSTVHGRTWADHEWLYGVLAYGLFLAGGMNALIGLRILCVAATLFLVWRRLRRDGLPPWLCWVITTGIAWAGRYAWDDRPDLFSFIFLAGLMGFVERMESHSRQTWLFWITGFALWTNLHAGFLLGLGILGLAAVGLFLEQRKISRGVILGIVGCTLATLLNPYGLNLHLEIIKVMSRVNTIDIRDWIPTPWHPMEGFWIVLLLFWTTIALRIQKERRVPWRQVLTGLALSSEAVAHVRNTPYFLVGAAPVVAFGLKSTRILDNRMTRLAIFASIAIAALHIPRMQGGIKAGAFPIEACDFIDRENIPGLFYNDYDFGGYWIWRLGPQRPVFLDGRFQMVEGYTELAEELAAARNGPPAGWERFLQKHHIDGALVKYPEPSPIPAPLRIYFPNERWALVYQDPVALMFVRRIAMEKAWLRRRELPRTSY